MRAAIFAIPLVALAAGPAWAQAQDRQQLPEIIIGAPPSSPPSPSPPSLPPPSPLAPANQQPPAGAGSAASGHAAGAPERCGDPANANSLNCMNEKLRQQVDRVNPPVTNTPPIDAGSQDLKTGLVNIPAVQQQYGRNFGVSAYPYRPPPPVYVAPIGAGAHR
jgi:hypothetical protein